MTTPVVWPLGVVLATLCGELPAMLAAQEPPPPLEDLSGRGRPRLPARADTNDWGAYFDYAVSQLRESPRRAALGFYWAARLDPRRPEPLYGRWVAYWMGKEGWWEDYLRERPSVVSSPHVAQVDSFYTRALQRNPFVPQTLTVLLYEQLPGEWRHDRQTNALLMYSAGDFVGAAHELSRLIAEDPQRYYTWHYHRALAFTGLQQWDSARVEITEMLGELRRQESIHLVHDYESKELMLYGTGLLHLAGGDIRAGQAALEEALVENLSFFPAHSVLGLIAMNAGDTARGLHEYSVALELARDEPWIRFLYGQALVMAGHATEAVVQLDRVVLAEPFFADAYLELARARERAGAPEAALNAYQAFLRLAPRSAGTAIAHARGRVTALTGRAP